MHHETVWTSKLIKIFSGVLLVFALCSCAENQVIDPPIKEPENRVYFESYDRVWRAAQLSLRKYPVKVNSIDTGVLETDFVKGDKYFTDPNDVRPRTGLRYKITLRVVKGKIEGKMAVKVTVLKTAEVQPDFFSGFKPVASNGLEEATIVYRISRFVEIDRLLEAAANKKIPEVQ